MKTKRTLMLSILTMVVALLPLVSTSARQKVPITFDKYHGYTGTVDYLKKVAAAYPDITELMQIGTSTLGRPMYLLVVSNMKNGTTIDRHVKLENPRAENVKNVQPMKSHLGKPGHFMSGATHGNEYTGTEVCLYIIDKLVSGYGDDSAITDLVDRVAFYILPIDNPDGVYNSVELGIPQRANSMYRSTDLAGKPVPDGLSSQFRYKSPDGEFVTDEADPRLMVRLSQGATTTRDRYKVITEYYDNAGTRRKGQEPADGIDMNRNYPEGWWTEDGKPGGTGYYPTSATEVHARVEFFMNHRNILNAQSFHTSGGFTYRAMGTAPHTSMNETDVAYFDFVMGKKYLEILGDEVPEAWLHPEKLNEYKAKMKEKGANKYAQMRGYELPSAWKVSYNEDADRRYGYGMDSDWLYAQLGIWAVTTELWNPAKDIPGLKVESGGDQRTNLQRALLKYQDEKYGGALFANWKKFNHPEHGDGEIGGWKTIYASNNAYPGEPLLNVCEKHWQFEKYRAELLPKLAITEATARMVHNTSENEATASIIGNTVTISKGKGSGKYRLIEVKAVIENSGALPTHITRGTSLTNLREDVVWLIGNPKNIDFIEGQPWQRIGVLGGTTVIPGVIRGGNTRSEVKWIIGVKGDTPLKIVVSSQKGGTVVKELTVK
jgi:hypothetical protein